MGTQPIYVSDKLGLPFGALPIPNFTGWYEFQGQIYCNLSESSGGGYAPATSLEDEAIEAVLEELVEAKGFILDVLDIFDYGLDQIDNLTEPDDRLKESMTDAIKSKVFDQVLDRLGDLIAAGKVDIDARP